MLALFIWGFALYGFVVLLWQIVRYFLHQGRQRIPITAVLIVHEGASYMEGILRTLTTAEPFARRNLHILVIDCGSADETVHIVEAMSRKQPAITLARTVEDPYQAMIPWLQAHQRSVPCLFDLRAGQVSPLEVVPTLAAFWAEQSM